METKIDTVCYENLCDLFIIKLYVVLINMKSFQYFHL